MFCGLGSKKKSRPENEPLYSRLLAKTQFSLEELVALHQRFEAASENRSEVDLGRISELGLPSGSGSVAISKRILNLLTKGKSRVSFEDYVEFLNLMVNADPEQKCLLSFRLIDTEGKGFFTQSDFGQFVFDILWLTHGDLSIDSPAHQEISETIFAKIPKSSSPDLVYYADFCPYFHSAHNFYEFVSKFAEGYLADLSDSTFSSKSKAIANRLITLETMLKSLREDFRLQVSRTTSSSRPAQVQPPSSHSFPGSLDTFDIRPETLQEFFCPLKHTDVASGQPLDACSLQPAEPLTPDETLCDEKFEPNEINRFAVKKPQFPTPDVDDFDFASQKFAIRVIEKKIDAVLKQIEELKLLEMNSEKSSENEPQRKSFFVLNNIPRISMMDANVNSLVFLLHSNWNLVLNMMMGIQNSIISLSKYKTELSPYDFTYKNKINLSAVKDIFLSGETQPKVFSKCYFFDYSSYVFKKIRNMLGVSDKSYLMSIGSDSLVSSMIRGQLNSFREQISSGKSGSFFYYSHDGKFVLKTISKREKKILRKILPSYYSLLNRDPESFIVKIFGLHKIVFTQSKKLLKRIYFIVMSNSFLTPLSVDVRYDLKGSLHQRLTYSNNKHIARKDLNFLQDKVKLKLREEDAKVFFERLQKDVVFLRQNKLLDYSLLLGIHHITPNDVAENLKSPNSFVSAGGDKIYFFSIIDFLTEFDFAKKSENMILELFVGKTVSCLPPDEYASRFELFLFEAVE